MNRRRRTQFWGADKDDDSLVLDILAGRKTATACQAREYHRQAGGLDDGGMEAGELVDVFDLAGRLRCVIRITDVYAFRFGDIPETLWRAEGCASDEAFREAHRRAWPYENLTDDFELIATHFELAAKKHQPGTVSTITKAHTREFQNPPKVAAGGIAKFERLDGKNPAWFFGADASGRTGYFPVAWFAIDAAAGSAAALCDYDASELTVAPGDTVELIEEYGEWSLVRHHGLTGWLPKDCIDVC